MSRDKYPEAADIIQRNTYMDDIIESTDDRKQAIKLTQDIEKSIIKGGLEVKEWMFSNDINRQEKTNIPIEEQTEKILESNGVSQKINCLSKSSLTLLPSENILQSQRAILSPPKFPNSSQSV